MEHDVTSSPPSPVPPPILPDIVNFAMPTSPVATFSVSCCTDSFEDLEIATLLKESEKIETVEQTPAGTCEELASQKALF